MWKRAHVLYLVLIGASFLASCGSSTPAAPGNNPTPTPTSAPDVVIMVTGISGGMSFSPASATMKVGQTVAWKNTDSATHRMVDNGGAFDSGSLAGGATSAAIKMTAAGTFPYHCSIHPSMTGTLTVNP